MRHGGRASGLQRRLPQRQQGGCGRRAHGDTPAGDAGWGRPARRVLRQGGGAPLRRIRAGAHRCDRLFERPPRERAGPRPRAGSGPRGHRLPPGPSLGGRGRAGLSRSSGAVRDHDGGRQSGRGGGAGRAADRRDAARSVVGIALVPDEPRRVLASRPVDSPAAFSGLRIRIIDNAQTAAELRRPGRAARAGPGRPADGARAAAPHGGRRGVLDGHDPQQRLLHVRALPLELCDLPEVPDDRGQSPEVGGALVRTAEGRSAGGRGHDRGGRAPAARPSAERVDDPLPGKRRSFAHDAIRVARVRRGGPACAHGARQRRCHLEHARRTTTRAGHGSAAAPGILPAACRHGGSAQPGSAAKASASIPNGVYVVTNAPKDWAAGDVINNETSVPVTYTTTLRNGHWYQTQSPNYPDQGPFSGTYTVHGTRSSS